MEFNEKMFDFHGGYLTYLTKGKRKFVARFKYNRGAMGPFKTFLKRNFTVGEYFELYDTGLTPIKILETKGYINPAMRKMCKKMGVEPTMANYLEALRSTYA